jgi:pimeloyl-ACP methyl ester carboxylesterase
MDDEIRPFQVDITDGDITDLRGRLRQARWPEPETVPGWSQGTPLSYLQELCHYWQEDYDFPAAHARLNHFPQFLTTIDGLDIHFLHVRSPHNYATPLLLTHGWPSSVAEFRNAVGPLTDPASHGGDPADAFHVVCPSLPGFGFSGKPATPGWGTERIATAWNHLMHRLGYPRYGAQGGDWGALVTMNLGQQHADSLDGVHLTMVPAIPARGTEPADLTKQEKSALASFAAYRKGGSGYSRQQSTRPQSIGYGLVDSPVALAGWIVEKFQDWTDNEGDPATVIGRDELLDNLMMYWLPGTGASAARIYWESFARHSPAPVTVPAACSIFGKDIYRPSRRWAEPMFPDLRYWHELESGGHFAAFEQPETFVTEVRTAFRTFR